MAYYFKKKVDENGEMYFRSFMGTRKETKGHSDDRDLRVYYLNMVFKFLEWLTSGKINPANLRLEAGIIELRFFEKHFPEVELDIYSCSHEWIDHLLDEFIDRNFHKKYQVLWELSLYRSGLWTIYLSSIESKFKKQKGLFRFYWTIYNQYSATRLLALHDESFETRCEINLDDHLVDCYEPWLLGKCYSTRIKLTTSLNEKQLVKHISKYWTEFLIIDSIDNFVNSNFLYQDSEHTTNFFPYSITVIKPASKFLTYLKEEDLILRHNKFRSEGSQLVSKPVEIQLWLEFTFRGYKGFTENNIEEYYLPRRKEPSEKKILR